MRVVELAGFMELPEGTIFTELNEDCDSCLRLKCHNVGEHDFVYADLFGDIGTEWTIGATDEWAMFDDEARFLIYEPADIERLVGLLTGTVKP